jgi:hypothetical protein
MPGSSTFRTVLETKTGEHGSGPIPLGPRYYFGKLTDPLEELVPRPTGSGTDPFAEAEPGSFAGTPEPAPPVSAPPGGSVAAPEPGRAPLSTAPTPDPGPLPTPLPAAIPDPDLIPDPASVPALVLIPGPDSTVTVRQPRDAQEPSTTQVTRPRPATTPDGTVAGSTPPCQGTPPPHQVEVQSRVAPAATA